MTDKNFDKMHDKLGDYKRWFQFDKTILTVREAIERMINNGATPELVLKGDARNKKPFDTYRLVFTDESYWNANKYEYQYAMFLNS